MLKTICILWLECKFTLILEMKHQSSKKVLAFGESLGFILLALPSSTWGYVWGNSIKWYLSFWLGKYVNIWFWYSLVKLDLIELQVNIKVRVLLFLTKNCVCICYRGVEPASDPWISSFVAFIIGPQRCNICFHKDLNIQDIHQFWKSCVEGCVRRTART